MTANELADKLDEIYTNTDYEEIELSATMLRNQQAELDAFKLNYYNTGYSLQLRDKDETIKQQQSEIEALKLRELTDEEIVDCMHLIDAKNYGGVSEVSGLMDFAKALLKKASDK
jgi:hypothetical protein